MISKNFAWTIIVVVLVAIAFFIYMFASPMDNGTSSVTKTLKLDTAETNLPAPTGNVDDLTKDLLNSATSEQEMISEEESDKSLIDADLKVIDEFGQSYNENEL